jgi:hypothetical protein
MTSRVRARAPGVGRQLTETRSEGRSLTRELIHWKAREIRRRVCDIVSHDITPSSLSLQATLLVVLAALLVVSVIH